MSCGDVAIDDPVALRVLTVRLQYSKLDQFSNGVDVVIGSTGDTLCPVAAVLANMASRAVVAGPFFVFPDSAQC